MRIFKKFSVVLAKICHAMVNAELRLTLMKEYMISLGTVMMMIAIAEILIPEGSIKKFASLAMGFMIITAITSPLDKLTTGFEFDTSSLKIDEKSMEKAETEYKEKVLERHKETLTEKIKTKIKHGSEVSVEVSPDGNLSKVTIKLKGDESTAVRYIVEELGLQRERIKLRYENN